MRFLLVMDMSTSMLKIKTFKDDWDDVILPTNIQQPIHFQIPVKLRAKVNKMLKSIIADEDLTFNEDLTTIDFVMDSRKKYNSIIMEKLIEFRDDNSEWYI